MSERWNWFYELVHEYLEPVLNESNYSRLTSPEYVNGENIRWMEAYFYENTNGEKLVVDILTYDEGYPNNLVDFYLIRIDMKDINLRRHLYPDSQVDVLLRDGWKCYTNEDVIQALKEIAIELKRFLTDKAT